MSTYLCIIPFFSFASPLSVKERNLRGLRRSASVVRRGMVRFPELACRASCAVCRASCVGSCESSDVRPGGACRSSGRIQVQRQRGGRNPRPSHPGERARRASCIVLGARGAAHRGRVVASTHAARTRTPSLRSDAHAEAGSVPSCIVHRASPGAPGCSWSCRRVDVGCSTPPGPELGLGLGV